MLQQKTKSILLWVKRQETSCFSTVPRPCTAVVQFRKAQQMEAELEETAAASLALVAGAGTDASIDFCCALAEVLATYHSCPTSLLLRNFASVANIRSEFDKICAAVTHQLFVVLLGVASVESEAAVGPGDAAQGPAATPVLRAMLEATAALRDQGVHVAVVTDCGAILPDWYGMQCKAAAEEVDEPRLGNDQWLMAVCVPPLTDAPAALPPLAARPAALGGAVQFCELRNPVLEVLLLLLHGDAGDEAGGSDCWTLSALREIAERIAPADAGVAPQWSHGLAVGSSAGPIVWRPVACPPPLRHRDRVVRYRSQATHGAWAHASVALLPGHMVVQCREVETGRMADIAVVRLGPLGCRRCRYLCTRKSQYVVEALDDSGRSHLVGPFPLPWPPPPDPPLTPPPPHVPPAPPQYTVLSGLCGMGRALGIRLASRGRATTA